MIVMGANNNTLSVKGWVVSRNKTDDVSGARRFFQLATAFHPGLKKILFRVPSWMQTSFLKCLGNKRSSPLESLRPESPPLKFLACEKPHCLHHLVFGKNRGKGCQRFSGLEFTSFRC